MLKFYTVYGYKSLESRGKAVPNKNDTDCRSRAISGSEWVDIWTVEIEAIHFSASVVPTFSTRYSKPEGRKMKLHAVTNLNMIGVGRYMEKDTNFNIKTHWEEEPYDGFCQACD